MSKSIQLKNSENEKIYPYGIAKGTILWKNDNPKNNITEKETSLINDEYDELIVYYLHSTTNNFLYSQKILKGYGSRLQIATLDGICYRTLEYLTDTKYKICTITTNSPYSDVDRLVIPVFIVGYKA